MFFAIYLSLGLRKGVQATREALKKNHPALQKMKIINYTYFIFFWVILSSWIRIQSGSGFTTQVEFSLQWIEVCYRKSFNSTFEDLSVA